MQRSPPETANICLIVNHGVCCLGDRKALGSQKDQSFQIWHSLCWQCGGSLGAGNSLTTEHFKMAFTMKTIAPSTKLLSPRPLSIRARTSRATFGRSRLVIEAKTVWQLEAGGANKNKETVTLNDEINQEKSFVSVGDKAHSDAERVRAAWCILGQRMKHQQSKHLCIMHLGYF